MNTNIHTETMINSQDNEQKILKILAVGNSFSVDAMEHLYQIAQNMGKRVLLGNLYIGGCTLHKHWNCIKENASEYHYYKNTDGLWTESPELKTVEYGLRDEAWDIITLQQASGFSGIPETYNEDLEHLIHYVQENRINTSGKLGWQMTWAYQQNSDHNEFGNYHCDQTEMYRAICQTVQNKILPDNRFNYIIPTGTAIQNMRTSSIGDTLTRDGFHLSYQLGRYIAGLTWYQALTGETTDTVSWVPDQELIPESVLVLVKESVRNAIKLPYQVTQCQNI